MYLAARTTYPFSSDANSDWFSRLVTLLVRLGSVSSRMSRGFRSTIRPSCTRWGSKLITRCKRKPERSSKTPSSCPMCTRTVWPWVTRRTNGPLGMSRLATSGEECCGLVWAEDWVDGSGELALAIFSTVVVLSLHFSGWDSSIWSDSLWSRKAYNVATSFMSSAAISLVRSGELTFELSWDNCSRGTELQSGVYKTKQKMEIRINEKPNEKTGLLSHWYLNSMNLGGKIYMIINRIIFLDIPGGK